MTLSPSSVDVQACEDDFVVRVGGTVVPPAAAAFFIVNRAGYLASPIAPPKEIVSLFGPHIGPDAPVPASINPPGLVSTELAGFRVLFDGTPAPLLYLGRNQINAIVPNIAVKESITVAIEQSGSAIASIQTAAAAFAPGIPLKGDGIRGQAAVINEDGTLNSASHPAKPESIASLFVLVNPSGQAGRIVDATAPLTDVPAIAIDINVPDIVYAGSSPGTVSAWTQINFVVPELTGTRPIFVVIGGLSSAFGAVITIR